MIDLSSHQYKNIPSLVATFVLPEPLDLSLPVSQQIEVITRQARLTELNPFALFSAGFDHAERLRGLTMIEMAELSGDDPETARATLIKRMEQFLTEGYSLEGLDSVWQPQRERKYFKSSYHGCIEEGRLTAIVTVHRDQNSHRVQQQLIAELAQELSSLSGNAFFSRLVDRLARTFGVDYCVVGELVPGSTDTMTLLACYSRDDQPPIAVEQEYNIQGSPSLELLRGESMVYFADAKRLFPDSEILKKLPIKSYLAVPVLGEKTQRLGHIALMDSQEIANIELVGALMSIFAIRVSAEIERRRLHRESELRARQRQIFIDNNASGMFVVDVDPPMPTSLVLQKQVQWLAAHSRFVEVNNSLLQIFGLPDNDSIMNRSLLGSRVKYDYASMARDYIGHGYTLNDRLIQITNGDSQQRWITVNISSVIQDEQLTQLLGVVSDATDRIGQSRSLEFRAKHDGLTGLPNRSYFIEQMEQLLSFSAAGSQHALFILDLDGFKEVNDTLGHETGDQLLIEIGPRIKRVLSSQEVVYARLGGDEFAVLIENYQSEEAVTQLASRLMDTLKSPFAINGLELVVGGSVGIATYPANADSVSSLMRCADIAMYQAKQQSRDYCLYSTDRDHYTVRRLSLMMDIRQSITNRELRLFYQPIMSLCDQQVVGFEALIRWQHPELGMLSPGEFIPLIELTDMIMPVTWWVVETAIQQLQEWREQGWEYRLSVNVSTRNLADVRFVGSIKACLERHGVEGRYLEIEITESTLMADPDKARQVLQSLSELGVRISIDDYGTGYSSLAYLKSLPINTLKIDQTFISQMLLDAQDKIIVSSTILLAHNLGLEVTAEGIEDISLIADLNELGCDKGQGYYFCHPIPVDELKIWLALQQRLTLNAPDSA